MVMLMLVLNCVLGLQSQIIYFINYFSRGYIPKEEQLFIEVPRYFKIYGEQFGAFLRLNKTYMVNPKHHDSGRKVYKIVF